LCIYLFASHRNMSSPTSVFLVLSGEHPTLPLAEMKTILDANRIPFRVTNQFFKLVEIEADIGAVKSVASRGAFIDEVGTEIVHSEPTITDIDDAIKSSNLPDYLGEKDSFNIRVLRFGGVSKEMSRVKLEGHLGWLMGNMTRARVDLEHPTHSFRGLLAGPYFHLGLIAHQRPADFVASRRPRKRPAFHPSTMTPKLARSMVNLSGAVTGSTFLDPFCGVGGILLEASLLGCQVIGIDALRRMVRGSRRNLKHFQMTPLALLRGDARNIPVRSVQAIATDPPYGTGASTLKSTTRNILKEFLPEAYSVLTRPGRLVVASPLGTGTPDIAESAGFKIADHHEVYVHRRLTREILVLEAN
jgi:tRNA (guanine10-N2)-dimethyltransferase